MTSSPPPPNLSPRAGWALAIVATLTMSVSYMDRQTLAALAPTVKSRLHLSDPEYGYLVSAFSIAYLVGAPLAGRLLDRVGSRKGLLGAVLVWSCVAALHAFAPSFAALFALRLALGLAEAPSFPGAAQAVHRALPAAARARAIGILFTGSSIGAMIAPLLAQGLVGRFGYRAGFLGVAFAGLVWIPLWIAAAFHPAAAAALDPPRVAAPPAAPADPSAPSTTEPTRALLWRNPAVLRALIVVIASAPLISLIQNWSATYLVHDHGLPENGTARLLMITALFFDVGAVTFGHHASRARAQGAEGVPGRLVALAAALAACCGLVPLAPGPVSAMLLAGVAMAGGAGLYALATADMLARVPPGAISSAGGITASAQSLAHIIVNPLIGWSIAATHSYTAAFVVLGLWVVPGSAGWIAWRFPRQAGPREAPSAP